MSRTAPCGSRPPQFGDEKDRVVRRSNGATTYFASDIAYHLHKFRRGFDQVVDIWGADHHGYVPRLQAAAQALGFTGRLQVILVQLVSLLRQGEPVAMTTRGGTFVTLREVMDEVGKDAARFIFLTRRPDAQLEFDLEVAKQQSSDNPVYYVQYAHARLASVFRQAAAQGIEREEFDPARLSPPHPAGGVDHPQDAGQLSGTGGGRGPQSGAASHHLFLDGTGRPIA